MLFQFRAECQKERDPKAQVQVTLSEVAAGEGSEWLQRSLRLRPRPRC